MSLETQLHIRSNCERAKDCIRDLNAWLSVRPSDTSPWKEEDWRRKISDLKQQGNSKVAQNQIGAAIALYSQAIDSCTQNGVKGAILATLLVNRSLCHLKQSQYSKCVRDCTESLRLIQLPKAFYRRGLAYIAVSRWDEAQADLIVCRELVPGDEQLTKVVSDELSRIHRLRDEEERNALFESRKRVHRNIPDWVLAEDEEEILTSLIIKGENIEEPLPPRIDEWIEVKQRAYVPKAVRLRISHNLSSSYTSVFQVQYFACSINPPEKINACWENCSRLFIHQADRAAWRRGRFSVNLNGEINFEI